MYYVGLDLGQRRDHTAVAVIERAEPAYGRVATSRIVVRHLQRAPLGTGYPAVVEAVREAVSSDELRGRCVLAVDATGLGAPVVDMLRGAGLGCDLTAVTITGGEREVQQGMNWSVPKRDLMAGLQVSLERGDLRIAKGIEMAGALVKELMNVRMSAKGLGRYRVGADGCGEHDDLVIAVALAVWRARARPQNGFRGERLSF
jgi:hypothetical protein